MNPSEGSSIYLKIDEAARLLGVSSRWVYRHIKSGDLPASKVGGLYFISRLELERILTTRVAGREAVSEALQEEPAFESGAVPANEKCSACSRLLTSEAMIGGTCRASGCDRLICSHCQAEGIAYCRQHTPDTARKLEDAQARYSGGAGGAPVKAPAARLLEINFLNRIQAHLGRMANLIHPATGELLSIDNWDALLEQGDARAEVMRLLNKVVLDSDTLARLPLNAYQVYDLPPHKRQKGQPLQIWIQVVCRMKAMVEDGFDAPPLTADELTPWLSRLSEETQSEGVFRLAVLASVTGWDASARQVIQGEAAGSAFMHRQLLVYLYDLSKGDLVYNPRDERARPYAELFTPLLPEEQLEEAIRAIQDELLRQQSLTLKYAVDVLPFRAELIQQAFQKLAAGGRYSILEMPEYGLVIVRK